MSTLQLHPIGTIQPGKEGFTLQLRKQYAPALQGLEGFSHLTILWWFDGCDTPQDRAVLEVPSPYRKAPAILGTFATRSTQRPNPIALSVAQILAIDMENGTIIVDYIDADAGTPILDLKPYTPSVERVEHPAVPAWCSHWPKNLEASGNFPWEEEFTF